MASETEPIPPHDVVADEQPARVLAERDVPPDSPAAGVVDDQLTDPPEPAEPG